MGFFIARDLDAELYYEKLADKVYRQGFLIYVQKNIHLFST